MAKITIAWELGEYLGHIARLTPLALSLKNQGHTVSLVYRDHQYSKLFSEGENFDNIRSPILPKSKTNFSHAVSFTETLLKTGYNSKDNLKHTILEWAEIFNKTNPDLIIFNHAPTALLASRQFNCRKIITGCSFSVPPSRSPMPQYEYWKPTIHTNRLITSERECVASINYALAALHEDSISNVHEIYTADKVLVDTEPSLDVYGERGDIEYLGVSEREDIGAPPIWPKGHQPKILVYIKYRYSNFDKFVEILANSTECRYLMFVPDMPQSLAARYPAPNIKIFKRPPRINDAIEMCNGIINHGSSMSEVGFKRGKPQLLIPTQMEQLMRAKKLESLGAALVYLPTDSNKKLMKQLLQASEWYTTPNPSESSAIKDGNMIICNYVERLLK